MLPSHRSTRLVPTGRNYLVGRGARLKDGGRTIRGIGPPVMIAQAQAILRLLSDDERETVLLVRKQLEESATLPDLRSLREQAGGRAAPLLDEIIETVAQRTADHDFAELCRRFGEEGDLEQAGWQLAATFRPGEGYSLQKAALEDWGERLRARLPPGAGAEARVTALAKFLAQEIGLRGNDADYYNIENSLLPRVIDSRRGIPISLALLYSLIAARAGMRVDGVSLPGHFVARHENVFFDPYHAGRRIGMEECAALLERQNLVLTPQHLQPTTPRQMLIRMLTNIYYIAEQRDPPLSSKVNGWIGILKGEPPS